MLTRIHVNGGHIKQNKKRSLSRMLPVFTVKDYKRNRKGNKVYIGGPSILVYKPTQKQRSGAVAWIETTEPVTVYK